MQRLHMLRDGPLFFFGAGEGFGQFPKKSSCTTKTAEKNSCKESHRKKNNLAGAFYYPGPVFGFKKFHAQAIAQKKVSCTT